MRSIFLRQIILSLVFCFSLMTFRQDAQAQSNYRGVMVGSSCDDEFGQIPAIGEDAAINQCANRLIRDINDLNSWRVNIIRFQIVTNSSDYYQLSGYQTWINRMLLVLDRVRPTCEQFSINIVVDLHRVPSVAGSDGEPASLLFTNRAAQGLVRGVWQQIATRYKNKPRIYAYDLVNEPNDQVVSNGAMNWHQLATTLVNDIRRIDTRPYVMIETREGRPRYISIVPIINDPRVIYSIHHYDPRSFTLGTCVSTNTCVPAPTKARLKEILQPVKDFAVRNGVKILVGEFSVRRDFPTVLTFPAQYQYLKDSIEIFEEFKFDWTYHAFRESPVWDVEKGGDLTSQNLLIQYFGRNRR